MKPGLATTYETDSTLLITLKISRLEFFDTRRRQYYHQLDIWREIKEFLNGVYQYRLAFQLDKLFRHSVIHPLTASSSYDECIVHVSKIDNKLLIFGPDTS